MLPIISNSVKNGSQVKDQEKNKESEICKEEVIKEGKASEMRNELDFLTKQSKGLKDSINLLDNSLVQMLSAVEELKKAFADHEIKMKNHIIQLEKKYEDKLQIYNDEMKKEFKKELTNLKKSMRDKTNDIENKIQIKMQNFDELPSTMMKLEKKMMDQDHQIHQQNVQIGN